MDPQSSTVEQKLARISRSQHGIATRPELLAAGLTADEIRGRVRKGLLLREYPGVYRVGHRAPSVEARYLAAVRACGEGAVLSGRAAAYLLSLLKGQPPPPEVTTRSERRVRGVITRRSRRVQATSHRGIPVTTVPQTVADLAAELDEDELARLFHEANVRYRTTPEHVEAVLRPNAPGAGKLRRVMNGDTHVLLSKLERGFLKLLKAHSLPLPETNRRTGSHYVDCRWPDHELTVELNSYRFHNSRHSWERDYQREREAYKRKDRFRRYTWTDVFDDPAPMIEELRELLLGYM
jgi:hypothetical protein